MIKARAQNELILMSVTALKVVALCITIGLCFGIYLYFTYDHRISRIVTSVLSSLCIGSLMTLAIYFRNYFTDLIPFQYAKVLIVIVLLIIAALIGSELTLFLNSVFFNSAYAFMDGRDVYILNILIALVTGIPMYISEEWRDTLNSRVLTQQLKLLQMQQQNTTFELELLRAKINPHFLYNVHNTIAGLIAKDPQKAERMVMLLSKFFRFTLSKSSATYHSIADEIDIIKTYLELQAIRYETRLSYDINADAQILTLQMPSFILQPLVENSIKHGIEKISGKGSITVDIALHDQQINIKVADTGADFPEFPGTGTGLLTVHNKLRLLYNENFSINFNKSPEKYVELIFPTGN